MEDLFSAQRQEQQRRWIQELDKQREEAKLRRQHDKDINNKVNFSHHMIMSSSTPICQQQQQKYYNAEATCAFRGALINASNFVRSCLTVQSVNKMY